MTTVAGFNRGSIIGSTMCPGLGRGVASLITILVIECRFNPRERAYRLDHVRLVGKLVPGFSSGLEEGVVIAVATVAQVVPAQVAPDQFHRV